MASATAITYLSSPITITPPFNGALKFDHPTDFAGGQYPGVRFYDPIQAVGYVFIPGYSWSNPVTGITSNAIWLTSDGKWTPASQVTPPPPQLYDDATKTDLSHYSETTNVLQNVAPQPTVVNQAPTTNVLAPPQGTTPITQQQIANGMPMTPNTTIIYTSTPGGSGAQGAAAQPMPSWLLPAAAGVLLLMFMGKGN